MKYKEIFEKIIEESITYRELKINYNISTDQLKNAKKYAKRYCPELLDQANNINEKLMKKGKTKSNKPIYLKVFNYVINSEKPVTNSDIKQKFNIKTTELGVIKNYICNKFPKRKEEFLSKIIIEHKKNRIYKSNGLKCILIPNEILKNNIKREDVCKHFNITSNQFTNILSNLSTYDKVLYKQLKQHFKETNIRYIICHDLLKTDLTYKEFLIKHKISIYEFNSMIKYYKLNDENFYNKLIIKRNEIKKLSIEQIIDYILENSETACFYDLEKKFDKSDNNIRVALSTELKNNPKNKFKIEQIRKILKNNRYIDDSKYTKLVYLKYNESNVKFILNEVEKGKSYFEIASILNVRASEMERFINTELRKIII